MAQCWYIRLSLGALCLSMAPSQHHPLDAMYLSTCWGMLVNSWKIQAGTKRMGEGTIWYVTSQVAQLDLFPMSFHPPPSTQYTQLHRFTINWPTPCNPCLGVSRMPTPIQLKQYIKLKLGSLLELNYPKLLLLVTDSAGYWEALKCISI